MTLWTTIRRCLRRRGPHPASLPAAVCLLCAGMAGRAQQMPSAAAVAALRSLPLTLPEADFPDGYVGLPFAGSILATGGSGLYSIIVGGDLPPGTYIERGGGVVTLSGVPTQEGTYEIRVGVTDVQQGGTKARTYTLHILAPLANPQVMMASITDTEGIKQTDTDSVFFPAKITDAEGIKQTDSDSVFMPAKISDAEGIKQTDLVSIFGPDKPSDSESFHFGDNVVVMGSAMVNDAETLHFGDTDVVTGKVGVSPATAPAGTYNSPYSQAFTAAGNTGAVTLTPSGTIPGLSFTAPASSTTLSGTPTAAGTYNFTISAHDTANTDVVSYSLTINKAAQSINLGTLPSPVYGGANFTLSGTSTSGAAVTFASNSGLATGSNPFFPAGAGTASFTASAATTSNYNAGTLNFNVSIAKATADVAVPGVTRAFDQPNPSFSYSLVGFVNGDTASVASGAPSITTAATPLSPVSGSPYAINIGLGTLTAANYNFGFAQGGVTVTKAPQTVTFYPLPTLTSGTSFPLSARASSGLAVMYSVSGPASISNNVLSVTGSGLVQVTASQTGNGNYNAATPVIRSFTAP